MTDKKFFEHELFTWILLFLFPPLGVVFLWINKHYTVELRVVFSVLFFLLYLNLIGLQMGFVRALLYVSVIGLLEFKRRKIEKVKEISIEEYKRIQEDLYLKKYIRNFIDLFGQTIQSVEDLIQLELYIEMMYPIKKVYGFHIQDEHYQVIYEPLEGKEPIDVTEKIKKFYDDEFVNLFVFIRKYLKIKRNNYVHYLTWMLFREQLIIKKSEQFAPLIKHKSDLKHLKDYVNYYINQNHNNLFEFTCYLYVFGCFKNDKDFTKCYEQVQKQIEKEKRSQEYIQFESSVLNYKINTQANEEIMSIDDVDHLGGNGIHFEYFIAFLFIKKGYEAAVTQKRDYGVDVIAYKDGFKYLIQAKHYNHRVGNEKVREFLGSYDYHKANQGIFITNNYFTDPAYKQDGLNKIVFWDRDKLVEELSNAKIKKSDFEKYLKENNK